MRQVVTDTQRAAWLFYGVILGLALSIIGFAAAAWVFSG